MWNFDNNTHRKRFEIIASEIVKLGGYIAGGSVAAYLQRKTSSDIDIYAINKQAVLALQQYTAKNITNPWRTVHISEFATTYLIPQLPNNKVQIIHHHTLIGSPAKIVTAFDFSASMSAVLSVNKGKPVIGFFHEIAQSDIARKRFRIINYRPVQTKMYARLYKMAMSKGYAFVPNKSTDTIMLATAQRMFAGSYMDTEPVYDYVDGEQAATFTTPQNEGVATW